VFHVVRAGDGDGWPLLSDLRGMPGLARVPGGRGLIALNRHPVVAGPHSRLQPGPHSRLQPVPRSVHAHSVRRAAVHPSVCACSSFRRTPFLGLVLLY
jgi:hypothetical protein